MLGTKPPKKWIGFRASSKQFQDLRLKSFEFNSCYSEQVQYPRTNHLRKKQHVIYICYMRINCSDLNSIFAVFFASNLPHSVTLKHFFTCGACSPQIWWILLTLPDFSCIVGTLLRVWIPAISPPFLAIFSRNFYAYSRNFSGCIFCRNFSVCISNFSVCIFNFSGCSSCCWFLFVFLWAHSFDQSSFKTSLLLALKVSKTYRTHHNLITSTSKASDCTSPTGTWPMLAGMAVYPCFPFSVPSPASKFQHRICIGLGIIYYLPLTATNFLPGNFFIIKLWKSWSKPLSILIYPPWYP